MLVSINFNLLTNLYRLWGHISNSRKRQLILVSLLMFTTSLMDIIGVGSVFPLLSVILAPEKMFEYKMAQPFILMFEIANPSELLLPITLIFCAITLLSGMLRVTQIWAVTRFATALGADFSVAAYRKTLYQPYAVHTSRNSSAVIAAVNGKTTELVGMVLIPTMTIANTALTLTLVTMALFLLKGYVIFLIMGIFILIYLVIVKTSRKKLLKNGRLINSENTQIHKALQEGLGSIRDVLIDRTQEIYCRYYENSVRRLRLAHANIQFMANWPRYLIESLGMIMIAGIAYYFVVRSGGIGDSIPVLGVLVLSAQRLLPLLQQFFGSWAQLTSSNEIMLDVLDLLDQPLPQAREESEPLPFKRAIIIKNLYFRHQTQNEWLLKNINISISKGARVGIIGTTGCGKSTLLDLLMGLLSPTQGQILIDDQPLKNGDGRSWHSRLAHVPQDIFLADLTIAENIAFGVPSKLIDYNRVKEAAIKAQIADTILDLPERYETLVGERGLRLSGGQRQRIGIARALYKNADIILFDEATSALDTATEQAVITTIDQLPGDLTLIIVTHRLSTLEGCSQIIKIHEGKAITTSTGIYKSDPRT